MSITTQKDAEKQNEDSLPSDSPNLSAEEEAAAAERTYAELVAMLNDGNTPRSPRLSFKEQCAAYGFLKMTYPRDQVASVMRVSRPTIHWISQCEIDGSPRYKAVAEEFQRLGEAIFIYRYVTRDLINKMNRLRVGAPTPSDKIKRSFGPNSKPNQYAGKHQFELPNGGVTIEVNVFWYDRKGWTYSIAPLTGSDAGKGPFPRLHLRFDRPNGAYDAALREFNLDPRDYKIDLEKSI
jgi:hypothetical protein